MTIQESGEMYLEAILMLSQKKDRVRSIDIAEFRGYSKPSVSRAVGLLRDEGFIEVDGLGSITLTEEGRSIAERIYERHLVLTKILISLGVPDETAADDACRIEHYISETTFDAIKKHLKEHGND